MVVLEPITIERVQRFKAIRLQALAESPTAFGSTYAREVAFDDAEWQARALRWNGETGIGLLAVEDGVDCGIAGGFLEPATPTRAQLISMWTAPSHRQRGVGRILVEGVIHWATLSGASTLGLMVTSANRSAILFYERLGFTMTGRTEPYPNDPALLEYEMAKSI